MGPFAFTLEIRPVTGRTLLLGGKLGFQGFELRRKCGDRLGDRVGTAW